MDLQVKNEKGKVKNPMVCKSKTTVFQKDSFWLAKGFVLECKRTRFGMQKDPFWSAKGVLLEMYSLKH